MNKVSMSGNQQFVLIKDMVKRKCGINEMYRALRAQGISKTDLIDMMNAARAELDREMPRVAHTNWLQKIRAIT